MHLRFGYDNANDSFVQTHTHPPRSKSSINSRSLPSLSTRGEERMACHSDAPLTTNTALVGPVPSSITRHVDGQSTSDVPPHKHMFSHRTKISSILSHDVKGEVHKNPRLVLKEQQLQMVLGNISV